MNTSTIKLPSSPEDTSGIAVEISKLRKTFNGTDFILDGINLIIPCGQVTAIVGSSGTGKSVLLKLILGLLKPTSGSIKVLGHEVTCMNSEQLMSLRHHFGMLFQDAALFDDMSALENVMFPLREHRRDLTEAQMFDIARMQLRNAGLEEAHFQKMPSELSGGMRKRVGLARALALNPEILIYDEPTTGLDPILAEIVDELIVNTEKLKAGTTSIVVSHDLYGALRIASHLVMLDRGKIVFYGTPKDFLSSEIALVKEFVSKGLHRNTPGQGEVPSANLPHRPLP